MYARPKPSETDDDLLRMQEEFFKKKAENKIKPAATVISSNKNNNPEVTVNSETNTEINIQEQLANTFEAVPTDINLGKIVEKKVDNKIVQSVFKFNKTAGFPQAKRRDVTISGSTGSLFAQNIKKLKTEQTVIPMEIAEPQPCSSNSISPQQQKKDKITISLPEQSYILTGQDSQQIHQENLNVIKQMSEQEILEEREKLIATMDPAIIAFLKSRRKKEIVENRNPTIKEQNEAADNIPVEEIAEVLSQPHSEKWLNFDYVESNKLAWMKNIDIPKFDKTKPFEARFDFEGWLLPYSENEINEKTRALYHHGDEPGRPGYTLQELFQLSRSSVMQQKIVALNCIANILSLNATGVYDNVIDLPIEQIFFVLRFCLDDNTPSVLNASIKSMRNLFYSQIDEVLLDGLLGFGLGKIQPVLAVDNDVKEDDNTVNDQQLAETNLVQCLARTEIVVRIRYIINSVQPAVETIVYCMEILIRLCRDSLMIMTRIFNSDGLIESIIKHFVPKLSNIDGTNNSYGLPLLQSVKLMRILSSRSKHIATQLVTKYNVIDSVITYLSSETYAMNANGLKLQIECFHFWSLLISYGLAVDYFYILEPILVMMLDYHLKNTNIEMKTTFVRQGHLASLLIFLGNIIEYNSSLIIPFKVLLEQCLRKWSNQFSTLTDYACGKLQIISGLLVCITSIRKHCVSTEIDDTVNLLINSNGFSIVTTNIRSGSMLLNNYETHKCSSNLKSLEGAAWHTMDHVVPIMQTKSCLPFLHCVARFVAATDNKQLKLNFLNQKNLQEYLHHLQKADKYFLTSNWFAKIESFLIMNILKISVDVQDSLDTSVFYELAVKCLSIFTNEQKLDIEYLINNIIFCSKFYPSHVLLSNLDINQRSRNLEVSLNNLDEIANVYTQVLGLRNNLPNFTSNRALDISVGNVIPIDWIYTPIIVLYTNQQEKKQGSEEQQIHMIKNCLRWILIYETYFPDLAATINPTDRFCRLACVFLGSDNLFLNSEIHELLHVCFKNVIKFENKFNFQKEIQGLNNFQDFYTQLLEQYQGVSYGDILFGNIILMPLAQKHNVQYRKTLWSEYMGVVQIFNVAPEQILCPLNLFLEPREEDMSILKCYRRAVVNKIARPHSVLFKIAKHHVEQYICKTRKQDTK